MARSRREQLPLPAAELSAIWDALASRDERVLVLAIARLQKFLTEEYRQYHQEVAAALAALGRLEHSPVSQQTLTPLLVEAFRSLPVAIRRQVSWRGVRLPGENLRGVDLSGLDLRDAVLDHADLSDANLSHTDLWDARLHNADLTGTNLTSVRFSWQTTNWSLARNWRAAQFDTEVEQRLLAQHGPEAQDPRVLMLLWEFPPFVSGGAWTATYHQVRKLRQAGIRVTLLVPWPDDQIEQSIFDEEVDVWAVGAPMGTTDNSSRSIPPPGSVRLPYGVYDSPWRATAASGPGRLRPIPTIQSGYASGTSHAYGGPTLLAQVGVFLERVRALAPGRFAIAREIMPPGNLNPSRFDLIHAHDWLTFDAARELAERLQIPWIAHFHSLEADRRLEFLSTRICQIERQAVGRATTVLVPSEVTRNRLLAQYPPVEPARVIAFPNGTSEPNPPFPLGEFTTQRVVYTGRFSEQKRPDLFVEVAAAVRATHPEIQFVMYGSGAVQEIAEALDLPPGVVSVWLRSSGQNGKPPLIGKAGVQYAGALNWQRRHLAYDSASLLIVPSQSEPFGMVILEAMQYGVPVMYPETAGAKEYLSNAGRPYDPTEVEGAARQVITLLSQEEQWLQVVAAQTEAVAEFQKQDVARQIYDIWETAVTGHRHTQENQP